MNLRPQTCLIISLLSSLLFLSSCIVKQIYPDVFESPEGALQQATDPLYEEGPFVPGDWPNTHWWLMFNDLQLNEYMYRALRDNPDLKIAQARIRMASYAAAAAGSPLWPTLGLETDSTRFRISKTGAITLFRNDLNPLTPTNNLPPPLGPPGFTFTQTEININGSYQVDFWQQNLNNFKAAVSEVLATEADAAFSTVALSISVAQAYFNLQIAYSREELANRRIENRRDYLKLIEKRFHNGIDTQTTFKTAQSNLLTVEESSKEALLAVDVYKNQLHALVTGNFLEPFDTVYIEEKDLVQFPLPTNLPLDLIAHRPDVTAAAWRVEEAAKKIKVSKAAFYPNFNITGLFGFQTIHPKELFKWRSIYGQVGPAINLPIFEGGLLQANLGTAYEQYYIAVEQYNQAIIKSVQNVLDSLAGLKYALAELEDNRRIAKLSEENFQIIKGRYLNHIDTYIAVLEAEFDTLAKQDQVLISLGNYYLKFTNLISALGGGYNDCDQCQ